MWIRLIRVCVLGVWIFSDGGMGTGGQGCGLAGIDLTGENGLGKDEEGNRP